jgi:hypothetical protein
MQTNRAAYDEHHTQLVVAAAKTGTSTADGIRAGSSATEFFFVN